MIVVDTNIVAYLYLPTERTRSVEALLEKDPEWAAPLLWRSELRNILATYVRRRLLGFEMARDIQAEAEHLLAGGEYEVDSTRVLELARDSKCSAYDCEFVSLAMQLDLKLVTADARLRKAFPGRAIALGA